MVTVEDIKKPIEQEFIIFENRFKDSLNSNNELLKTVNQYILQKRGKQIRPILTFLSAKNVGEINEDTYKCAVSMEMLHTASLLHDDVVDDTYERRGQKSVNAIWKNKVAILVGDFLLSKSLSIASEANNQQIIKEITNLGKEISEGELLQITNAENINQNEEKYLEVIRKKTATLFSTCTYTGAITTGCTNEEAEKMRRFGDLYGICFQIKDDIFDYISSEKEIGKPVGNDIREGKITLPLLYALNSSTEEEKNRYLTILKNKDFTEENIQKLISFAIEKGGIEYAEEKINFFKNQAIDLLQNTKNKEVRNSLVMLLEHTSQRKK